MIRFDDIFVVGFWYCFYIVFLLVLIVICLSNSRNKVKCGAESFARISFAVFGIGYFWWIFRLNFRLDCMAERGLLWSGLFLYYIVDMNLGNMLDFCFEKFFLIFQVSV